MYISHLTKQ